MAKQGPSSIQFRGNHDHRSPTPPPRDKRPPRHSLEGNDEEDYRCPLSRDIMRALIPTGFERPPP
ncbi:hypothetical protein A2U01_0101484, partial [Trifolium medium]|nr:hypothetical protein [Trifolium medium]